MMDILEQTARALEEGRFSISRSEVTAEGGLREALAFEDDTVLGFALGYETVSELLGRWKGDGDRVAMKHRNMLQAAQQKAWNTYLVLLCRQEASFGEALALGLIEEDLEGMRKITKAGVDSPANVRAALLPLLPFRAAPVLDPIDMKAEIQMRTSELDPHLVEAFLSTAEEAVVLQIMEERT